MRQLTATHLLIHEDVMADPLMRARAERMRPFIDAAEVRVVDDAALDALVEELRLYGQGHHGMHRDVPMIVLFNRFLFADDAETMTKRREEYPNLFRAPMHKLNGHGTSGRAGYEWRDSGSPRHRLETGSVCQPAWQLHTVVGCPFRCAYCSLGWVQMLMMNIEALVDRLDEYIGDPAPHSLFQHDNYSDIPEFEPEYGSSKAFIDYFARKPECYLELYVGKSDKVDYLLDFQHGGKTTCCWSIGMRSQCDLVEREAATMENRLKSAARCQEAGYPVRFRYSPIIPMRNWRDELREMVEMTFDLTKPEMITFESIRFTNYAALEAMMDLDVLDPQFVDVMRRAPEKPIRFGCEVPDEYRQMLYRAVIDEIERMSPRTPYAFCREARVTWDLFAPDLSRHDQRPGSYVCNCGPMSSPDNCKLHVA